MSNFDRIVESFRLQSGACRLFGSPFTADLLQEATNALERGGVLAEADPHGRNVNWLDG